MLLTFTTMWCHLIFTQEGCGGVPYYPKYLEHTFQHKSSASTLGREPNTQPDGLAAVFTNPWATIRGRPFHPYDDRGVNWSIWIGFGLIPNQSWKLSFLVLKTVWFNFFIEMSKWPEYFWYPPFEVSRSIWHRHLPIFFLRIPYYSEHFWCQLRYPFLRSGLLEPASDAICSSIVFIVFCLHFSW